MKEKLMMMIILCFLVSLQAIDVSDCGTLDIESGEYIMINDIIDDAGNCFEINNNNIVFDCDGYSIGNSGTTSRAFNVVSQNNITIKNCNINDVSAGIWLSYTNDSFIFNNSFYDITNRGITITLNSTNNNIYNNSINSSLTGIILTTQATNNTVNDNIIYNIENYAIYINSCYNTTAEGNFITKYGISGLYVYSSVNNIFNNNVFCFLTGGGSYRDIFDYDLNSVYSNTTYDTYRTGGNDTYFNKTSGCPNLSNIEISITPSLPESINNLWCNGSLDFNNNALITSTPINFSWYKEGVYNTSKIKDCTENVCENKLSWLETNTGDNWTCAVETTGTYFGEIDNDTVNILITSGMFTYNTSENILITTVEDFNTSYLMILLSFFTIGVIGIISKKASTTALGGGVLLIILFVFFGDTTFILLSVVLFLAGLGSKKMGF